VYKAGIISETVKNLKIERKLLLTAYIKSYTGFRLPPKCMTLNDLWARFKVIDSLNAAKMAKYSLVIRRHVEYCMDSTLQWLRVVCAATARLLYSTLSHCTKTALWDHCNRPTLWLHCHFFPTPPLVSPKFPPCSPGTRWIAFWLQRANVLG